MNNYLRTATKADMDLLFEWANDPQVRKKSFSTQKISYEEHKKWFEDLLKDKKRKQYIYMVDGKAIGQARVGLDKGTAEISYSICAAKRGLGFGRSLLRMVCLQAKQDFPEILKFIGEVKPENEVSQKAFLSAGFQAKKYTYEALAEKIVSKIYWGGVKFSINSRSCAAFGRMVEGAASIRQAG